MTKYIVTINREFQFIFWKEKELNDFLIPFRQRNYPIAIDTITNTLPKETVLKFNSNYFVTKGYKCFNYPDPLGAPVACEFKGHFSSAKSDTFVYKFVKGNIEAIYGIFFHKYPPMLIHLSVGNRVLYSA